MKSHTRNDPINCILSYSDHFSFFSLFAGVGKSSLLLRFADNTFSGESVYRQMCTEITSVAVILMFCYKT